MSEHTTYELISLSGRRTSLPDREALIRKVKLMRQRDKGYFVYELTETESGRSRRFAGGWNPKV